MRRIDLDYDWEMYSKMNFFGTREIGKYYEHKKTGKTSEVFEYATEQVPNDNVNVTIVKRPNEEAPRLRNNNGKFSPMYTDIVRVTYQTLFGHGIANSTYEVKSGKGKKFIPAGLDSMVECESILAAQTLFAYSNSVLDLRRVLVLANGFDREAMQIVATFADKDFVKAMLYEAKQKVVRAGDSFIDKNTANFVEAQDELIREIAKVAPACVNILQSTSPATGSKKCKPQSGTETTGREPNS